MQGPSNDLRGYVASAVVGWSLVDDEANRVVTSDAQESLEAVLDEILFAIRVDIASEDLGGYGDSYTAGAAAREDLAAVEAWLSVASYATAALYAPQSPLPRGLAGWAGDVAHRLRQIAEDLRGPMQKIGHTLAIDSWSIGLSFPWGVSLSASWNL